MTIKKLRKTTVTDKQFQQGVSDCDYCMTELQPGDKYYTDGFNVLCERCNK